MRHVRVEPVTDGEGDEPGFRELCPLAAVVLLRSFGEEAAVHPHDSGAQLRCVTGGLMDVEA
jgi:hypothetical protein